MATRGGIKVFQNTNLVGFVTFSDPDTNSGLLPIRSKQVFKKTYPYFSNELFGASRFSNTNLVGFVAFLEPDPNSGLLPARRKTIVLNITFFYEIVGAVFFFSVTKQQSWINMQNTIALNSKVISVIYYK